VNRQRRNPKNKQDEPAQSQEAEKVEDPAPKSQTPVKVYNISLKQLGQGSSVELRGTEGERSFPFTVRSDEVITSAKIRYGLTYSPALLPDLSHVKVLVNNELVGVVPLPREDATKGDCA
jgi:hypothetical protein